MSEIAGRLAVQIGAHYLEQFTGGRGVLLPESPVSEPGECRRAWRGIVGSSAIRIAVGMGARVTVINLDIERLRVSRTICTRADYHWLRTRESGTAVWKPIW